LTALIEERLEDSCGSQHKELEADSLIRVELFDVS
jgi:hypothetical protein